MEWFEMDEMCIRDRLWTTQSNKEDKTMLNHVELLGRLAQEPEIRYTQSGTAVASFDLAVQVPSKNKDAAPDYIPIEMCIRDRYKKSSGEWYQFFTSKDKELRDTQAELQKARKALEAKEGEQNHGNDKESNS